MRGSWPDEKHSRRLCEEWHLPWLIFGWALDDVLLESRCSRKFLREDHYECSTDAYLAGLNLRLHIPGLGEI